MLFSCNSCWGESVKKGRSAACQSVLKQLCAKKNQFPLRAKGRGGLLRAKSYKQPLKWLQKKVSLLYVEVSNKGSACHRHVKYYVSKLNHSSVKVIIPRYTSCFKNGKLFPSFLRINKLPIFLPPPPLSPFLDLRTPVYDGH